MTITYLEAIGVIDIRTRVQVKQFRNISEVTGYRECPAYYIRLSVPFVLQSRFQYQGR